MTSRSADAVANRPPSVGRMFLDRVAATPGGEAYRRPVGAGWESITWRETGERVQAATPGALEWEMWERRERGDKRADQG